MPETPLFHIVIVEPKIPGNTGSIGRTCVALNIPLIVIGDPGFDLSEKAVRRAGLDYWKHLQLYQYQNFAQFLAHRNPTSLSFYTKSATTPFYQGKYQRGHYLIFGSETQGLPKSILQHYPHQCYSLPMYSKQVRSLNLANAATAVAYEALRQISYVPIQQPSHSLTG